MVLSFVWLLISGFLPFQIEIVLGKSEKFDSLVPAPTVEPEPVNDESKEDK